MASLSSSTTLYFMQPTILAMLKTCLTHFHICWLEIPSICGKNFPPNPFLFFMDTGLDHVSPHLRVMSEQVLVNESERYVPFLRSAYENIPYTFPRVLFPSASLMQMKMSTTNLEANETSPQKNLK